MIAAFEMNLKPVVKNVFQTEHYSKPAIKINEQNWTKTQFRWFKKSVSRLSTRSRAHIKNLQFVIIISMQDLHAFQIKCHIETVHEIRSIWEIIMLIVVEIWFKD